MNTLKAIIISLLIISYAHSEVIDSLQSEELTIKHNLFKGSSFIQYGKEHSIGFFGGDFKKAVFSSEKAVSEINNFTYYRIDCFLGIAIGCFYPLFSNAEYGYSIYFICFGITSGILGELRLNNAAKIYNESIKNKAVNNNFLINENLRYGSLNGKGQSAMQIVPGMSIENNIEFLWTDRKNIELAIQDSLFNRKKVNALDYLLEGFGGLIGGLGGFCVGLTPSIPMMLFLRDQSTGGEWLISLCKVSMAVGTGIGSANGVDFIGKNRKQKGSYKDAVVCGIIGALIGGYITNQNSDPSFLFLGGSIGAVIGYHF
ncbi:MAG: hypothetical protein PHE49_02475 [bacterium]|nr:hypothetical protein [bacterium]